MMPTAGLQRPAGYGYPPATNYAPGYPQPTGYPQYGGYPGMPPAPRRQTPNTGRVLLGLLLVPLALFAVILIVKVVSSFTTPITPEPTVPVQPTVTSTTTQPTSTSTPPPGGFANEDYTVPDPDLYPPELPSPDTYSEATQWMQANVFYNRVVQAPVRCDLINVDPARASKSDMQTYLNDIVACLMRVWAPELQASGYNASRPSVVVYSTASGQSACGKLQRQNAFYCAGDQQIYYSMDLPTLIPEYQHDPVLPMLIMAHEFGHAIQAQTGILWSEAVWQQSYTDNSDNGSAQEISRRTEMQADCFAGEFLTSVSKAAGITTGESKIMADIMLQLGDDAVTGITGYSADHGLGVNRQTWFETGLSNPDVIQCNTFDPSIASSKIK